MATKHLPRVIESIQMPVTVVAIHLAQKLCNFMEIKATQPLMSVHDLQLPMIVKRCCKAVQRL